LPREPGSRTICNPPRPSEVVHQLDIGGCELLASAADVIDGESYEYAVPDLGWEEDGSASRPKTST